MTTTGPGLRILAIDCCEHILETLRKLPGTLLLSRTSKDSQDFKTTVEVNLIVIGVAHYPIRRFFVSQLRRVYSALPILILRREQVSSDEVEERVRGEFLLSDHNDQNDCEVVQSLRRVMPFETCSHISRGRDYDAVRALIEALSQTYPDPTLNLAKVALKISISPKRLSIILNNHVGIGFRELLRNVRIEEAKRMLRTRQYSVKEVAARVGFTDSHYFSKSFKELTGQNASEYQERTAVLN